MYSTGWPRRFYGRRVKKTKSEEMKPERLVVMRLVTCSVTCLKLDLINALKKLTFSTVMNFKNSKNSRWKKKNSERELFIEHESAMKGMVGILSRISFRNIC